MGSSAAYVKPPVKAESYHINIIKEFFVAPGKAIDKLSGAVDVKDGLIFSAISLTAIILFVLLLCGSIKNEFGGSDFGEVYGIGILAAIIGTAAGIGVPTIASYAGASFNKKWIYLSAAFNSNAIGMLPVAFTLLLAGMFSLVSFKFALLLIIIAVFVKIYISATTVNRLSHDLFSAPVAFWATTGIAFGIKLVEYLILWAVAKSVFEDLIENLIYSVIF